MAQASAEKLKQIGPAEKESGLSATKETVSEDARVAFAKRKKKQSHQYRSLDCEEGESK